MDPQYSASQSPMVKMAALAFFIVMVASLFLIWRAIAASAAAHLVYWANIDAVPQLWHIV